MDPGRVFALLGHAVQLFCGIFVYAVFGLSHQADCRWEACQVSNERQGLRLWCHGLVCGYCQHLFAHSLADGRTTRLNSLIINKNIDSLITFLLPIVTECFVSQLFAYSTVFVLVVVAAQRITSDSPLAGNVSIEIRERRGSKVIII